MSVTLYDTETRYTFNQLTFQRGTVADVVRVGVYHNVDPDVIPALADFTTVDLVFAPDPLAETGKIDIAALIGPNVPAHLALAAGVYQRWCLIETSTEKLIYKVDTVTVLT